MPLPLSAMLRLGFDASDVMETVPLKLPADDGVKVTLNEILCHGVNVSGVVIPGMLNPVPLTVTWEMVTLPLSELVNVSDTV